MLTALAALTVVAAPTPGVHEYRGSCSKESFTASAPLPITARPTKEPVSCGSLTIVRLPGKDHATFQLADPAGRPLMAFDGVVRDGKVAVGHYLPRPGESYPADRTACTVTLAGRALRSLECTGGADHDQRREGVAVFFDAQQGQTWR